MVADLKTNHEAIIGGVELVTSLVHVLRQRRAGAEAAVVAEGLADWRRTRADWWSAVTSAEERGVWMSLPGIARRFALADREIDVLLVALAPAVDPEFLAQAAPLRERLPLQIVDVDLVVSLLCHTPEERFAGRNLLTFQAPLLRSGLVRLVPAAPDLAPGCLEVRPADSLADLVLERPLPSGPLAQYCEIVRPIHTWERVVLPEQHKSLVWELVSGERHLRERLGAWGYGDILAGGRGLVLLFAGPPGTGKTAFAHSVASRLGRSLLVARTSRLLSAGEPLLPILVEMFRTAVLADAVVLLDDCEPLLAERNAAFLSLVEALEQHEGLLILATNLAPRLDFALTRRILLRVDFDTPSPLLREQIWELHLPPDLPMANDINIPMLARTYEFTGAGIRNAVLVALSRLASAGEGELTMARLREAAETQLTAQFGDLAVRTSCELGLDALVLPQPEYALLREILAACRNHEDVLNRWGFGRKLGTGRGLCVLFDGPPGTGKTFAAELLAADLKRPLFRVHIPQVVSKWLGETERNIAEIFVRARASRALLLFDEADALFGRRVANTQTANDRYANMEVNQLLQEIERYDGITILTTNLFGNLDEALQRRIQFRVTFPFPEPEERARIWGMLLPPETPTTGDLDFRTLAARYELAGGHIKNALLRAA